MRHGLVLTFVVACGSLWLATSYGDSRLYLALMFAYFSGVVRGGMD